MLQTWVDLLRQARLVQPTLPCQLEDPPNQWGDVAGAQSLERLMAWHLLWKPAEKAVLGENVLNYLVANPEVSMNVGPRTYCTGMKLHMRSLLALLQLLPGGAEPSSA